jgi:hypothetical protein
LKHYRGNCLEEVRKTTKISAKTVGISAKIRTRHISITNSEALYQIGRFSFLKTFFSPTFIRVGLGQLNFIYVLLLSYATYGNMLETNVVELIGYRSIFYAMCQLFVR